MYAALAKLLLSLACAVIRYMDNKQLMEAGAAVAALKGIQDAQDTIARADAARVRGVRDDWRDPYDTDNK